MRILSIETSCDETAVAIIEAAGSSRNGIRVSALSNIVHSQVKLHARYGGVYPSLAKREHAKNLIPVLKQALRESNFFDRKAGTKNKKLYVENYALQSLFEREPELLKQFLKFIPRIQRPPLDAIAVTHGPGLEPALWVGINFAKALSLAWNIPVIPINHMEGHIFSALLKKENEEGFSISNVRFPVLVLLISGGHTELVLMKRWLDYKLIGETQDDAVGEAFDKVARMLKLPYPGGPDIERCAQSAQKHAEQAQKNAGGILRQSAFGLRKSAEKLVFPRPMMESGDFNFSFSGLKTAVLYKLKEVKKLTPPTVRNFSYEFQEAVTDVLVKKTIDAAKIYEAQTIAIGGGVSANERVRERLAAAVRDELPDTVLSIPSPALTTDNALMIAVAGYVRASLQKTSILKPRNALETIRARGTLRLS